MLITLLIAILDPEARVLLEVVSVSDPRRVTLVENDEVAIFYQKGDAEIVRSRVTNAVEVAEGAILLPKGDIGLLDNTDVKFEVGYAMRLAVKGEDQVRRIEAVLADWPSVTRWFAAHSTF